MPDWTSSGEVYTVALISFVIAILTFVYLVVALLKPEKF